MSEVADPCTLQRRCTLGGATRLADAIALHAPLATCPRGFRKGIAMSRPNLSHPCQSNGLRLAGRLHSSKRLQLKGRRSPSGSYRSRMICPVGTSRTWTRSRSISKSTQDHAKWCAGQCTPRLLDGMGRAPLLAKTARATARAAREVASGGPHVRRAVRLCKSLTSPSTEIRSDHSRAQSNDYSGSFVHERCGQ